MRLIISLTIGFLMIVGAGLPTPGLVSSTQVIITAFASENQGLADLQIEPFTIDLPEAALEDLQERLARTRMPDEQNGVGWMLGMNQAYLRQLLDYWQHDFDWRVQERRLNQFEQFKTRIDGVDIHFIHQRSTEPDAFPLILTHGWPGSFAEFSKVIGPLTDPIKYGGRAEDAFHVVVPSIPGYGFSDRPREFGWNAPQQSLAS